jgi:hypothetical protein
MNQENSLDYRMGTESLLNAGVSWSPGLKVTWSLQANARRTAHDKYLGELVPSTGASMVNLTPGMRVQVTGSSAFYTFLQFPVYQNVNDAQLAPRTGLLLGMSTVF